MSTTTSFHLSLLRGVVGIAAGCAVLLTVACGGGGGGILSGGITPTVQIPTPSGPPAELEAKAVANKVYSDFVAMLSNARPPAEFIADFTQACRQDVSPSALQAGIEAFRKDKPGIVAKKMDRVDFHADNVTVEKRSDGFDVSLPGTKDATVQVDGKPTVAHEYFVQQGLEKESEGTSGSRVRLVMQGGKLLVSDCGQLKGVADYKPSTPVRTTPTAVPKR